MTLKATLALCLLLVTESPFAQADALSLQTELTLQSHEELQQRIGDAGQAQRIFAGAIAAFAPSVAGSERAPRQLNVIAEQVPVEWLPAVNGVTFKRLEWTDAKRAWENDCPRLLWVAATVDGSELTVVVVEGNKCHRRGTHYVFHRTADGWRSASEGTGNGFGIAGDPCACR